MFVALAKYTSSYIASATVLFVLLRLDKAPLQTDIHLPYLLGAACILGARSETAFYICLI
jgi:hypothetical protein